MIAGAVVVEEGQGKYLERLMRLGVRVKGNECRRGC